MSLRHTTLTSLFNDIADAIRSKTGDNATIIADDFDTAIVNISVGHDVSDTTATDSDVKSGQKYHKADGTLSTGTFAAETKTATPKTSDQTISPSSGKYLSGVTVKGVSVPNAANILSGSSVTSNGTTLVSGSMTNNTPYSATLGSNDGLMYKTSYTIPKGYHTGTGTVKVNPEDITVTPETSDKTITATTGKVINSVIVKGVSVPDASKIVSGYSVTSNGTTLVEGTNTYNCDASDTTATVENVLSGEKFYNSDGTLVEGSMNNNVSQNIILDAEYVSPYGESYTIPEGYHDGTGTVSINPFALSVSPTTEKKEYKCGISKVISKVVVEPVHVPESQFILNHQAVWTTYYDANGHSVDKTLVLGTYVDAFATFLPPGYYLCIDREVTAIPSSKTISFAGQRYGGYFIANITGKGYKKATITNASVASTYPGSGIVVNKDGTYAKQTSSPLTLDSNSAYVIVGKTNSASSVPEITFS